VSGLTANDIELTPNGTGATKGALSGGPTSYTLAVSGITKADTVTVSISKDGYIVNPPASRQVAVHRGPIAVSFGLTANAGTPTQSLTLTFNPGITSLQASEITVTGATKGSLSGSGTSYTLGVSALTQDSVKVKITKSGYSVTHQEKSIAVQRAVTPGQVVNPGSGSLKEKFGVTTGGKQSVTDTFNAVHAYIQAGGLNNPSTNVIRLGDYIELEAGLTVLPYGMGPDGLGEIYCGEINSSPPDYSLIKIIVVGINSFHSGRGAKDNAGTPTYNGETGGQYNVTVNNNTSHVVFQFELAPAGRIIHNNNNGYVGSEMRYYLVNQFLTGLISAGVPTNVMWAPVRYVANRGGGNAVTITDKLWLPTAREMLGEQVYSHTHETADNQARLEYYATRESRLKTYYYWLASPSNNVYSFLFLNGDDCNSYYTNLQTFGCVPAFCIK
jgi:hypothetical protein